LGERYAKVSSSLNITSKDKSLFKYY